MANNIQHILPLCTVDGKEIPAHNVEDSEFHSTLGEELVEKYRMMMHDMEQKDKEVQLLQNYLYESENLCISMREILSEPLFWYNNRLELQGCNTQFHTFFSLNPHSIHSKKIVELLPIELSTCILKEHDKNNADSRLVEYLDKDKRISLFVDKSPLYSKDGVLQGYMVYLVNATELRKKDDLIEYHATHDELTGLLNRFEIQNRVNTALNQCVSFAIVMLDVDRFSDINKVGVGLGDDFLQIVANRLRSIFPNKDIAHLGGDEFIILFLNITKSRLVAILEEALSMLMPPVVLEEYEFLKTYTFAVTMFPKDGTELEGLWQNLILTRDWAKKNNTKIEFFKKSFSDIVRLESKRKEEVKRALAVNDVINAYQPRIDSRTGNIVALEALARIRGVNGKIQLPREFIAEAEYDNLIHELGSQVLYNACMYAHRLSAIGGSDITISVNVSAKQFEEELVKTIDTIIARCGMNPKQLELEITESVMIQDVKKARNLLEQLIERGVKIAIDDFGKGYSSLHYIKNLPINTLKIDKDFTQDAFVNYRSSAILRTIVALGNDLGMQVVAEGIETYEHFVGIEKYHCTQLQGDYISPPLLEDEGFAWLSKRLRKS